MIAFYAWTDTLLINAVRLKEEYYGNEDADLIVLCLDRVSSELLKGVEQTGLFSRIVILNDIVPPNPSVLHKATKLFRRRSNYLMLTNQLAPLSGTPYRLIITGGFWSYFLFIFQYFRTWSPDLEIAFLEEGTASYNGSATLFRCDPLGFLRSELYRIFYYRTIYRQAVSRVKTIFLYRPEAAVHTERFQCRQITYSSPQADALLSHMASSFRSERYVERDVIFFSQVEPDIDHSLTLENIIAAAEVFGAERILVKTHPADPKPPWLCSLPQGVYADTCGLSFELIVGLVDWSNKLLIAKGTSSVLYPCYMLGQEPAVLFTYNMYEHDRERDIPAAMAGRMRGLYMQKERVMSASSREGYRRLLSGQSSLIRK